MARILSVFFLLYLFGFVSLRLLIHSPGTNADQTAIRNQSDLLAHSDRHDFKRLRVKGTVTQAGHYFWDLLLIPTYTLKTSGGLTIHVFASGNVPSIGRQLELVSVFRQYYKGRYGTWLGLVELEREYLGGEDLAGGERLGTFSE